MKPNNLKISICTVSMNRLHQLQQTLPRNIADCEDYENLEFVVLDYNSKDGMEQWMQENMYEHITSGRLTYYKTKEPSTWNPSHSKNLAFKLATGDVLANIWADYYAGKGFASYLNQVFSNNPDTVLTPIDFPKTKKEYNPPGDVLGKVCVKKTDFEKIGGFDERMDKHGFEDYDFVNRLEIAGLKRILIENTDYLRYISHPNDERYALPTQDLVGVYVDYLTPSRSNVLFLYRDKSFELGVLIDNFSEDAGNYIYAYTPRDQCFEFGLQPPGWQIGNWELHGNSLELRSKGFDLQCFAKIKKGKTELLMNDKSERIFYSMTDRKVVDEMLTFKHFFYTRNIMEENLKNKIFKANQGGFGKGTVYKNFQANPIIIS